MQQDAVQDLDVTRLEQLEKLVEENRYGDALAGAISCFQHYRHWRQPRLTILAARCLAHLGQTRRADAIILRSWRRHRRHDELTLCYLNVLKRRWGLLSALQRIRAVAARSSLNRTQVARLRLYEAGVLIQYRDFDSAEQLLLSAKDGVDAAVMATEYAALQMAQDRHQQALAYAEQALASAPGSRYALQLKAHLQNLLGDAAAAIATLERGRRRLQSFPVLSQLFHLYVENRAYTEAQQLFVDMQTLLPESSAETSRELNRMQADLLCAQQRYEQALPLLERQATGYWKSVAESINKSVDQPRDDKRRCVLDVPFVRQSHMTCAPASITAVAGFWGKSYSQAEIVAAICYDGTPAVDERRWVEAEGWHCIEFEMRFATIKALIDAGMPVLLATVEPGSAHLQVVVGYDESMGTYLLRDPNHPRLNEMLISGAHEYYASSGPRCMLMLPPHKLDSVSAVHFEACRLYDDYFAFSRALDQHDRAAAFTALQRLKQTDERHRLTLWARRSLAYYDRDSVGELQVTEALLQRYPADVNLQLAKVTLLSDIGSVQQTLAYLESLQQQHGRHFLLQSRLAAVLSNDQRQSGRVEKILARLLRIDATHAPTLYTYAGLLWSQGDKRRSYEIYRLLACLEDKAEYYIESYFKAARHFNDSDAALALLRHRYQRFHRHSSAPAISLFNALYSLDREQEGIDLLREAMAQRPQDGDLMLFTARQLLMLGDGAGCEALIAEAGSCANKLRLLELHAELKEHKLNRRGAIEYWRQLLAYEPVDRKVNNAIMRLHMEMGETDRAHAFIDAQLQQFPGNYGLLRSKLEHLPNTSDSLTARKQVLRELISHHPDDGWAYAEMASSLILEHRLDEALQYAQEAVAAAGSDAAYHSLLGEVYFARQAFAAARDQFRRAIALCCDYSQAFELLLQCVYDVASVKSELAFIHRELLRQVSFGEGILQYQELASRWLPAGELEDFLQSALRERADLWQCWAALARFYRDRGRFERSLDTLDKACRRFPLLAVLYAEKAEVHRANGCLDKAERELQAALQLSPGWTQALQRLADVLELQGRMQEAVDCVKKSIARSPAQAVNYGYLADLQWRRGEKAAALAAIKKALAISPFYSWAWQQLKDWSQALGQAAAAVDAVAQVKAIRRRMPNDESLLRIHAQLEDDPGRRADLLLSYIDDNRHSIVACTDAVDALIELQRFEPAFRLCDDSRWSGRAPPQIMAARALVYRHSGKWKDAVATLRELLASDENYYDAWRYLALWYEEMDESARVVEAIRHCQRIFPNDPKVLCFVAEKLQQHNPRKDAAGKAEITRLLQRAFQIKPNEMYIGLSYIDDLLDNRHHDAAAAALERLTLFVRNAFVEVRALRLACETDDRAALPALWQSIIQDAQGNAWTAYQSWELISRMHWQQEAVDSIDRLRRADAPLLPLYGEYHGYYNIEKQGLKTFIQQLMAQPCDDPFYDRQLEAYLRRLLQRSEKMPAGVKKRLRERFRKDITNWGLVGHLLIDRDMWFEAWEWLQDAGQRCQADPWMLYLASIAARTVGRWREGEQLIAAAYRLEADNYREDIEVWYAFDRLIVGDDLQMESLQWLKAENLAPLSQYPFALVKALLILDRRGFVEAYGDIGPALRECQRQHQRVQGMSTVKTLKDMVRKRLADSIGGNFWHKLLWRWRLGNHF